MSPTLAGILTVLLLALAAILIMLAVGDSTPMQEPAGSAIENSSIWDFFRSFLRR